MCGLYAWLDRDTESMWENTHLTRTGLNYGYHGSVGFFYWRYTEIYGRIFAKDFLINR